MLRLKEREKTSYLYSQQIFFFGVVRDVDFEFLHIEF